MIGNAHIDPVWLWTVDEGREEVLNTYRTAIMLIREYPGYIFTSGAAATYKWVQQDDPALFADIQQAVAAGQWAIVNGWMIQPDCNIPGGESFARHALYAQRYFGELLGARARVGYNVDTFGHAGTLPQILKLSGLDYYVFFRPGRARKGAPARPLLVGSARRLARAHLPPAAALWQPGRRQDRAAYGGRGRRHARRPGGDDVLLRRGQPRRRPHALGHRAAHRTAAHGPARAACVLLAGALL